MSFSSQKTAHPGLMTIRNNLAHVYRFGGVCTALKFNPSNISNEESKKFSNLIMNSLNEELWEFGIDIITTNYNNGGVGFMLVTTTENKEKIKNLLENLHISRSLKNEYVVMINDILGLSTKSRFVSEESSGVSYLMTIFDTYKINTQNQFSLSLNEEANTSCDCEINERSLANIQHQLAKLGLVDSGDRKWLALLSELSCNVADKSKKVAVPLALIAALVYLIQFLYRSYNKKKHSHCHDTYEFSKDIEVEHSSTDNYGPAEPNEPNEPAGPEPAAPAEPAGPADVPAFNFAIDDKSNSRLTSLMKTLEDSDVKENRANLIEDKILKLLGETSTTH